MVRKVLVLIAIAIPLTLVACGGDDSSSSTTAASDTGASSTEASTTEATTTEASTTEDAGDDDSGSDDSGGDDDGGSDDGAASGGTASGPGGSVSISETEYQLSPSDPTVKSGNVSFEVSNDGGTVHDLEIEGNGIEEETEPIAAGSSAKLTANLKPGTYEIYCNIGDHRAQGMEGTLTVN